MAVLTVGPGAAARGTIQMRIGAVIPFIVDQLPGGAIAPFDVRVTPEAYLTSGKEVVSCSAGQSTTFSATGEEGDVYESLGGEILITAS